MSREVVDRVVEAAAAAYAEGLATPERYVFIHDRCCVLGAAAIKMGVDKRELNGVYAFGRRAGLTDDEVSGITSGWDGHPIVQGCDRYAHEAAKQLAVKCFEQGR